MGLVMCRSIKCKWKEEYLAYLRSDFRYGEFDFEWE